MNNHLVSVIINCYNGDKFLKKAVLSVLNQTYKNIELIFWDNVSTDNSACIIKSFKDKRIKYFKSRKFTNLYEARNLAIKKCEGKFVSFLDTDDWWAKEKIEKQINLFKTDNQIYLVYSNFYSYNEKKNKKFLFFKGLLPEGYITQSLLNNYVIGLPTILIKKSVFLKEKFESNYNIIGDFDFIIRISKKFKIKCIQEPLAYYRIHNDNYSSRNLKNYIYEIKHWLKINKKMFDKQGFLMKNIIFQLLRLKTKYFFVKIKDFLGM